MPRRLLILGPSFRRNEGESLTAFERYSGVYFRVAKKHLKHTCDVDVVVMTDDLVLTDDSSSLPYVPPEGDVWGNQSFPKDILEDAKRRNYVFLMRKLKSEEYSEVFIAMGRKHAKALPDLSCYDFRLVFPTLGGLGPKARALKEWILR